MIYFFEFGDNIIESGLAPANLCYLINENEDLNFGHLIQYVLWAETVYSVKDNKKKIIKNRNGVIGTYHLSDEDALALKLKAVFI